MAKAIYGKSMNGGWYATNFENRWYIHCYTFNALVRKATEAGYELAIRWKGGK